MRRHTPLFLLILFLAPCALPLAWAGIPKGYYDAANGKKKAALKAAMHDIIQPVTVLSYGSGANSTWSGFYKTDRTSDNQVIDRYSYDVRYFTSTTSAVSGMNIEHSFPKSWWGGNKNNAYQDLFNLMPCESGINSSKSNYAMGIVTNVKTTNGCTKVGTGPTSPGNSAQLWEPADEWKGDFARDYFYMVTAYSHLNWTSNGLDMLEKNDWPTMQQWAYTLLLQWAKDDPVDEIERKRNDAVYDIQSNRNPFVDFPYLAEYIWGDSTTYAFNVDGSSSGGGGGGDETPDFATLVECSLKSGLDPFFVRTSEGCEGVVWTSDASYGAKANAYNLANKESDEYLMLNLDLTHSLTASLSFSHATGYNKTVPVKSTYFQVLVSEDYEGVPEDATWRMLDADFPPLQSNSSFTQYVSSGDIDLSSYSGKEITLAFRYTSTSSACYCWEVKDVKVTAYTVPDGIRTIDNRQQTTDGIIYNLAGQRLDNSQFTIHNSSQSSGAGGTQLKRGIYIVNGKKILK